MHCREAVEISTVNNCFWQDFVENKSLSIFYCFRNNLIISLYYIKYLIFWTTQKSTVHLSMNVSTTHVPPYDSAFLSGNPYHSDKIQKEFLYDSHMIMQNLFSSGLFTRRVWNGSLPAWQDAKARD